MVKLIKDCPAIIDQVYEILSSKGVRREDRSYIIKYMCDPSQSIYDWQNYLLWKLMTVCRVRSTNLCKLARESIKSGKDSPVEYGCLLYLSVMGSKKDKCMIRDSMNSKDSYLLQRHKLLALKGMDWVKDEMSSISDTICKELKGNYRIINSKSVSDIVNRPKSIRINDIFRSVHQYD